MRRMVKENLLKFDATPLFPERIATTVLINFRPQKLSFIRLLPIMFGKSSIGLTHSQTKSRLVLSASPLRFSSVGFTLSKLALFVIGSPAQFRNRFSSLSNVNLSGSQNASKNAAPAAEKTE